MEPSEIIKSIDHASGQGPWWMFIAILVVLLTGAAIGFKVMFTYFKEQGKEKDATIRSFADAMNRRAKADSARTEIEALQFASRPDVHPELKQEANRVLQRLKEDDANQQ
jgi:hypothetical protein